ncbi:MAG TPA: NAD(P)H-dependent oxidoreductase [Opitutaceae bacterium]
MPARRPRIVIVNGALAGTEGNTSVLLARAARLLARRASVARVTLAAGGEFTAVRAELEGADGILIGTGTHWDSWSSVLQKFLEDATPAEGTALWLGKPTAVVVTEHSVGGKGVLSRLQGVLVTLGCTLPPMSGLVLAQAAVLAAKHDPKAARDFWCADDLAVVCHNLLEAAAVRAGRRTPARWRTWPVDRRDFGARWLG